MTLNQGVKIPILDLLVSSSLKLVVVKMKAIIVLTIHSTSFSQADSFEADFAEKTLRSGSRVPRHEVNHLDGFAFGSVELLADRTVFLNLATWWRPVGTNTCSTSRATTTGIFFNRENTITADTSRISLHVLLLDLRDTIFLA